MLAAGLGTRMRPLTNNTPKPMLEVAGRSLLDRALDRVVEAGVKKVVVNTFYLPEIIEEHLAKRKDVEVVISRETERLETGGGILNARHLIGDKPFYVITTDVVWIDSGKPILQKLAESWSDDLVALLALQNTKNTYGYDGAGDFNMDGSGHLSWRGDAPIAEYVFTGLQIMCPKIFDHEKVKAFGNIFALNQIYKEFLPKIKGVENTGRWLHIGTPEALAAAPI
jgi:MurNAc alpha-1-phosphate uridylyltransferase